MTVWKEPADVATTEALGTGPAFPASGVIDSVTLKVGYRVLVKDQLTSTENGYYKVVAGPPPTLVATGDTIEAEDVTRVNEGKENQHTAWALIDATERVFVRQDVKHYSVESIDALKSFWQALSNATATVAGYWQPGDRGGGEFRFMHPPPEGARILSAKPFDVEITAATNNAGLVTIKAPNHGLDPADITTAYISGLDGLKPDAYYVKVEDADTLTLPGYVTGVSFMAGARVQYVKLATAGEHNRSNGQRIRVTGVVATDGAVEIKGTLHQRCGVIDPKTLSIPVKTSGGKYESEGPRALIGDDALTVPATDEKGKFGGLWQRLRADHIDVKWFGAIANWNPANVIQGKDNLAEFEAAIAASGSVFPEAATESSSSMQAAKLVAEGFFHLSGTLHITKAIELVGAANNTLDFGPVGWRPGTALAFPEKTTGIRIHSVYRYDSPDGGSGSRTVIRDLAIISVSEYKKWNEAPEPKYHGIHASAPFSVENVNIENFRGNGINIVAAGDVVDPEAGNAETFQVINCNIGQCAGHGVYVRGYANAGLVARTTAGACQGWGFFDESIGNTYVACHGESNLGHMDEPDVERSYKTTGYGNNCSVFVGCYSEGGGDYPAKNDIVFPGMVLGGYLAAASLHIDDSSAFVFQGGIASRAPLVHVNEKGTWPIQVDIGALGDSMDALAVSIPSQAQYVALRLNEPVWGEPLAGWLSFLHNGSRHLMQLPLTVTNLRRWAPQFRQGIFYYSPHAPTLLVSHSAGSFPPLEEKWEIGDVIWNDTPSLGRPIGWACTSPGTQGTLNPAEFAQFGRVEVIGTTIDPADNYKARAGEHVVIRTAGTTVRLPATPDDGDSVEVLNMSGGDATVKAGANTIYAAAAGSELPLGDNLNKTFTWIGGAVKKWKAS
jgi:hypothetical protein